MKFVGFCFLLFMMISCGDKSIVNQSYEFDNETWQKKNRPQFSVDIKDTTKLYDFVFIIRTNTSYAYSNMWLYLHSKAPKGKPSKEALQVKIADGLETKQEVQWNIMLNSRIVNCLLLENTHLTLN